jgi:hypothetical protein
MRRYWRCLIEWRLSKLERLLRSTLEISFPAIIILLLAVALPAISQQGQTITTQFHISPSGQRIFILIALTLIVYQVYRMYLAKTYDHSLVMKFQADFDNLKEKPESGPSTRHKCASACLSFMQQQHWQTNGDWGLVNYSDEIEDILDFLEDLGFYLRQNQLSDEVVYHHFCHWILIYVPPLERYINKRRVDDGEPTTWEHVAYLYKTMVVMEAWKSSKPFKFCIESPKTVEDRERSKLATYLKQELDPLHINIGAIIAGSQKA